MSLPNEIMLITTNLASGYHRDLQVIKESFLPVFSEIKDCLAISQYSLEHIIIKDSTIQDEKYKYLFSVEVVNQLVLEGKSFRDAYQIVGNQIEKGEFSPNYNLDHSHEGSIGNLCTLEIKRMAEDAYNEFPFQKIDLALQQLIKL
jgi:argininosuccinate lyase